MVSHCMPITGHRNEAYELSKSAEYDKTASSFKDGEDMRLCEDRHAACDSAVRGADREHLPPNRLNVDILVVCRQAYVEANPILWSTNTWAIHDISSWCQCRGRRNALQRRLIKKGHLGMNVVTDYVHKTAISLFKIWDELHIDITVNYRDLKQSQFYENSCVLAYPTNLLVRQYFRAKKITVICSGRVEETWTPREKVVENKHTTT
jgi:hypothetical protein